MEMKRLSKRSVLVEFDEDEILEFKELERTNHSELIDARSAEIGSRVVTTLLET